MGRKAGAKNSALERRPDDGAGMIDEKVEEFLKTVAAAPLSVLLLDYDGTLAPFSVDRQEAVPYEGLERLLQQIADTGRTRLVIVTGRDAREIPPLLRLQPSPEVWGAHGLQRLKTDGSCEMPEIPAGVVQALDDGKRWLADLGLEESAEMKPGSIAVHWRALENKEEASKLRGRVLLGWFPIAERASLRLLEFDGGAEMRLPDQDKGHAVQTVLTETAGAPIAYLGDDATDEHAFQALDPIGLTVLVRPTQRRTSAQAWLKPPDELMEFLSRWLGATQKTPLRRSANQLL
jgi:trehalose-phosphatase